MIHNLRFVVLFLAGENNTILEDIQISADIIDITGTVSQTPSSSHTLMPFSFPHHLTLVKESIKMQKYFVNKENVVGIQ